MATHFTTPVRLLILGEILVATAVWTMPASLRAHGNQLQTKRGEPVAVEVGPHGGGVVDVGDGHFELVRDPSGALSLYRLDANLLALAARDVRTAQLYILTTSEDALEMPMQAVDSDGAPRHFGIDPGIRRRADYMAVVSVSMGGRPTNLRFLVEP
jgi:hypothetical protein